MSDDYLILQKKHKILSVMYQDLEVTNTALQQQNEYLCKEIHNLKKELKTSQAQKEQLISKLKANANGFVKGLNNLNRSEDKQLVVRNFLKMVKEL
jgi:tellurite resistance protein